MERIEIGMNVRECAFCDGTGNCPNCGGNGKHMSGPGIAIGIVAGLATYGIGLPLMFMLKEECEKCDATGRCPVCGGRGH